MTGQTASPRGRVSLLGVIVGGLLIGAGGFGLLRVTSANPSGDLPALPPLPPVSEGRPDPFGLPPVIPAAAPVPVVLPPLGELPKPGEVAIPPAPLPPPALPVVPSANPDVPKPGDLPKLGGAELPGLPSLPPSLPGVGPAPAVTPALPELPPARNPVVPVPAKPAPLPTQPIELAPLPAPLPHTPPMPPANPDFNLRPSAPGNTVHPRPSPVEVPPVPRPVVTVLPAPVGPLDPMPTPGDPPVTLNLRQTLMSAAIGTAFALAPTPALRAEEPPKPPVEVDVKKQIADLKEEVRALRKQNEVQADYILGRSTDGKGPVLPVDLGLLKRVQTLEEAIARIEKKLDATKQVVGASPLREGVSAGSGLIRLINEYPTDVKIVVNGKSYDLKANELKEVAAPAGEFVYELLATGAAKTTSTIRDGERVTLRIR